MGKKNPRAGTTRSAKHRDARMGLTALALVALAWLVRTLSFHGWDGMARHGLLVACAAVVLWAWWRVAFGPPPLRGAHPALKDMAIGASVGAMWTLLWTLLPAWGLLKLASALAFAPVVAWRRQRAGRLMHAAGVWLGWGLVLVLVYWVTDARSWPREPLLTALGMAAADHTGAHYQWSRLMDALAAMGAISTGGSGTPPVPAGATEAAWLLRVGAALGWLPMGLVASAVVWCWLGLAAWLARSPVGARLALRWRRLGLTLALLHALSAALYGAWSLGYLMRPMGALAPLGHAGWWLLTAVLTLVTWRAYQQRQLRAGTCTGRTEPTVALQHPRRSLAGLWNWRSGWTMACLSWLALSATALGHFPAHVTEWQEARSSGSGRLARSSRLEVTDRTGSHLLATNVKAYDLWLRPSTFWAASWANPEAALAAPAEQHSNQLTDAQRRAVLLDALTPWPQAQALAKARLERMHPAAEGPNLLLWAQPEAAADAVRKRLLEAGIGGFEALPRMARHYPQGAATAHAVGYVGLSDQRHGQDGLELALNRDLAPSRWAAQAPRRLRTTLDLPVQHLARAALRTAMDQHGASEGAVIVVDVATGGVRALVSAPDFDPNDPSTYRNPYQPERLINHATARPMTLGSMLTPLLAAHLLQRGEVQPNAVLDLRDLERWTVWSARGRDFQPDDQVTLADIVASSSRVGHAKLALSMNGLQLQSVLSGSGLHGPGGIYGLLEAGFQKPDWPLWEEYLQLRAGQNLSSTLARTVQAYLPIANGGLSQRLSMVSDEAHADGRPAAPRVLRAQVACEVRRMLHLAAGRSGTAPLAQMLGVSVAGKADSSTRLPYWAEGDLHYNQQLDSVFVGMLPAEMPQHLIGVRLGFADNFTHWNGQVAAPLFAEVARGLLAQGGVNPLAADHGCTMPEVTSMHGRARR